MCVCQEGHDTSMVQYSTYLYLLYLGGQVGGTCSSPEMGCDRDRSIHVPTYPIPTYLLQATGTLCFLVGRLLVKLNGAVAQLVPVSLSQCGEYGRSFVPPCFGRRLSGHPIANLSRKRTLITPSATNGRLVGGTVADVL